MNATKKQTETQVGADKHPAIHFCVSWGVAIALLAGLSSTLPHVAGAPDTISSSPAAGLIEQLQSLVAKPHAQPQLADDTPRGAHSNWTVERSNPSVTGQGQLAEVTM